MKIARARSFPRAGLLGNPSDGYFGKTLSFAFADYCVDLKLAESEVVRFVPGEVDDATFDSPAQLVRDIRLYGYYGGIRMLKAVAKLFFEYCYEHGITLPQRNFTAEYRTNIPRLVGLSGSSAICSAMLKALCRFYDVPVLEAGDASERGIPLDYAPTLCLEAEKLELGINCGFQDRVIQMYGGLVFMDFRRDFVEANNRGLYEPLDASVISATSAPAPLPLYVAFDPNRAEESGKAHRRVKRLFEEKKPDILAAMSEFADIAQRGRDLLVAAQAGRAPADFHARFAELVNANFDLRDRIFNVAEENRRMVMVARSAGASAKFAGSGGAIVGTFEDEAHFNRLRETLATIGCTAFVPTIGTRALEQTAPDERGTWRKS